MIHSYNRIYTTMKKRMNHDKTYQQNKPHKHNRRKWQIINEYKQNNSIIRCSKTDPIKQYIT